jgi:hypothetical protein
VLRHTDGIYFRIEADKPDAKPKQGKERKAKGQKKIYWSVAMQVIIPSAESFYIFPHHGRLLIMVSRLASVSQCSIKKPCGLLSDLLTLRK